MNTRAEELREQIGEVRADVGRLLDELERRGKEAVDLKLQARRHPRVLAGAAALVIGLVTIWVRRGFTTGRC